MGYFDDEQELPDDVKLAREQEAQRLRDYYTSLDRTAYIPDPSKPTLSQALGEKVFEKTNSPALATAALTAAEAAQMLVPGGPMAGVKKIKSLAAEHPILSKITTPEQAAALTGKARESYLKALDEVYGSVEKRAADMGFGPETWYHGTGSKFSEFSNKELGKVTGKGLTKSQHWMSSNPEVAETFAAQAAYKNLNDRLNLLKSNPEISKLKTKMGNPISSNIEYYTAEELSALPISKKTLEDLQEIKSIRKILSEDKYSDANTLGNIMPVKVKDSPSRTVDLQGDSWAKNYEKIGNEDILVKNIKEGYGDVPMGNSRGIVDPAQIRSKFAAFDPRFADSDDLLAGKLIVPNYREEQEPQNYAEGGLVSSNKLVAGSLDRLRNKNANQEAPVEVTQEEIDAELAAMQQEKLAQAESTQDLYSGGADLNIPEVSDEELLQEIENQRMYGDRFVETAALSGLGDLTFGAIPKILEKAKVYKPGEIASMEEYNPYAAPVGTIGSVLATTVATGGTGLAGQIARKTSVGLSEAAGIAAEKAVENLLKSTTNKVLTKEVIKKSVQHAARGATEGAAFGLADLANENAIGKADFNAENILGYAGTGALFSGLTMAALPGLGASAKAIKRQGQAIFDKSMTKIGDPLEALLDVTGATGKARVDILENKEMAADLLPWAAKKFTPEDLASGKSYLDRMKEVNASARKTANDILDSTSSDLGASQPGLVEKGREAYRSIIQKLDEAIEYQTRYNPMRGQSDEVKRLTNLRNSAVESYAEGRAITPIDYRRLRQEYDELAEWSADKPKAVQAVAGEGREILNNSMHDLVSTVDPVKGAALKEAFKDMRYTIELLPMLEKKTANTKSSLMRRVLEAVQAAGLVHLAGAPGLLIAGGIKLTESDLFRRTMVMRALKKANDATEKTTKTAIENFLFNPKLIKKTQTVSALTASYLGREDGKKEPKNKQEAYQNVVKNLSTFTAEPETLLDRTAKATAAISHEAPETAAAASHKMINAVHFLQSKVPKNPYAAQMPGIKQRPYMPSSMDLAKFENYMEVIESPLVVLEELQSGTLTRAHVEALQAVYPEMYNYIRTSMINKMQDSSDIEMSYTKRVQASILLDIISDNSMMGQNIMALQQNFQVQEKPEGGAEPVVKPTAGGVEKLKSSERAATETQAFLNRKSNP